jgi:chromosome segregation ATPase
VETRRALEVAEAFTRNTAVRWTAGVVAALLTALFSISLVLAKRELSSVHGAIETQTTTIEGLQGKFSGLQTQIGQISEKLVRVEERYATQIPDVIAQIGELRRRVDQIAAERERQLERWDAAMSRHEKRQSIEGRIERAIRRVLGGPGK